MNYEGRPADYYVSRIASLKRELDDVAKEFDSLAARELPPVNSSLSKKQLQPVTPIARDAWNKENADSETGAGATTPLHQGPPLDGAVNRPVGQAVTLRELSVPPC